MAPEVIEALAPERGGIFVDCTAGGGGHSLEIAKRLPKGSRLICLDRDDEALEACTKRLADYSDRVTIVKSNFRNIASALDMLGIEKIDGVMWDLGVSSHQLDDGDRGFSYSKEAPLDMRMDQSEGKSAYDVVNYYTAGELTKIIKDYGEERFASRIANLIVQKRAEHPIEILIAAADMTIINNPSLTLGTQPCNYHSCAAAKVARHKLRTVECVHAVNLSNLAFYFNIRPQLIKLLSLPVAVLKNIFSYDCAAFSLQKGRHKHRLRIGRKARIRLGRKRAHGFQSAI